MRALALVLLALLTLGCSTAELRGAVEVANVAAAEAWQESAALERECMAPMRAAAAAGDGRAADDLAVRCTGRLVAFDALTAAHGLVAEALRADNLDDLPPLVAALLRAVDALKRLRP